MFGYIQPLKCELKVREYDYYRSEYCGLCNALRTRYGMKAGFIVNYDFVFVALLFSAAEGTEEKTVKKRCIACKTKRTCIESDALDKAADVSIILTYLKLCDEVSDNTFLKKFFCGIIPKMLLNKSYKKACERNPQYCEKVAALYSELCMLEHNNTASIDEPADKFAQMISFVADFAVDNQRILSEMFYHVGRFVYIIDALDDFEDDFDKREYNPIVSRYGITLKKDLENVKKDVITTLEDSRIAVLRAFELLKKNSISDIIRNIIELGMVAAVDRVVKKEKKNEKSILCVGRSR